MGSKNFAKNTSPPSLTLLECLVLVLELLDLLDQVRVASASGQGCQTIHLSLKKKKKNFVRLPQIS